MEFGVQPELSTRADGTPLYAPFHVSQSVPAMLLAHLTVAGLVEAAITAGVVAYLQRANLPLLRINHPAGPRRPGPRGRLVTQAATPQWLLQREVALCPCGCIGRRRKGSFVEKTLAGGAGVLRQALFSEDVARGRGLLQRLDPR